MPAILALLLVGIGFLMFFTLLTIAVIAAFYWLPVLWTLVTTGPETLTTQQFMWAVFALAVSAVCLLAMRLKLNGNVRR